MKANNIQGGGLICTMQDQIIVSNLVNGIGMHWVESNKIFRDIMPWFMIDYKNEIYYSDASRNNSLYKLSLVDEVPKLLVSNPVYLLQQYEDDLFYINEDDRKIYKYSLQEKSKSKVVDDEVKVFIVGEDGIWYSNTKGIFHCDLQGRQNEKIEKCQSMRFALGEEHLFFIDTTDYQVNFIELNTGKCDSIKGAMASSINVYKDLVFYNNVRDKSNIYRYSMDNKFEIKFISEAADCIHIIDEMIYYLNRDSKAWMQVPLYGGKSTILMRMGRE